VGEDVPVAEALAVLQVGVLEPLRPQPRGRRDDPSVGDFGMRHRKERLPRANTHLVSRRRGAEEEPGRELAPVDCARGRRERRHDRNAPARRGHLVPLSFPLTPEAAQGVRPRGSSSDRTPRIYLTVSHRVARLRDTRGSGLCRATRLGTSIQAIMGSYQPLGRHARQLSIPHRPMVHIRTTR
jgi:hypothetical protein